MKRTIPIVPLLLFISTALGADLHVPTPNYPTVQAAIDDANDGDTVIVEPNTYTGAGNWDIDFLGKAITVCSVAPEDPCIVAATVIDCQHLGAGFRFKNGEDSNSVLNGLTVTNSSWDGISCGILFGTFPHVIRIPGSPTISNCIITNNEGAGIGCVVGSSPTISNCIITDNNDGGIDCGWGSPLIINCDISGNSADDGGGVCCSEYEGGSPMVIDCTFTNNSAIWGGAIANSSAPIINCTFIGNSVMGDGGAIFNSSGSIINCRFMGNTAGDGGGALADCWMPISNSIFIANSTSGVGGALYNCAAEISSCVLSCNWASGSGGAIYDAYCPSVTNCTFSGNSAGGYGGGIFQYGGSVTNCILWGNTDSTGGTGESSQIGSEPSNMPYVTFSCIQDYDANGPFGGEENNNIDDNPMFVREPNNGGDGWGDDPCTPDVNEGENDDFGDLHLQNGSPCINTGDTSFPIRPNAVDIDGQPRIMGERLDMGADEFLIPWITVLKPEGGEAWVSGSLHKIAWESDLCEGPVDILLSKDGGSDWQTIESNLPNEGSYIWHLPDIVDSNQCLISVEPNVPDPNIVSVDSGLFTIHPDSPGPAVVSKWKSLGGNFDRIGLSQDFGPETGCVKWKFETDRAVSASVTIGVGDRVHIACEDGRLYTLDANGVLLWSYDTNSPLISSATLGPDGTVYVGGKNGKLYAINIDGNLRWTHTTEGFIYSSPAVSEDGHVYVCSQDGKLYALGQDGSELWSFATGGFGVIGGSILASPTIAADGTIYIAGLYDSNLYALDPNDGSKKWVCHFDSNGWLFASPVIAPDGTVYQTLLYDPNLYAIDPNNGNIIWATHLSKINSGGPGDSYSYSEWFEPYYYEGSGSRCWYPDLPFMYWGAKYNVGDSGWSEPALGPDGTIYVSLDDPWLRAVDPNGAIKWIKKPGARSGYTEICDPFGCVQYDKSPSGFSLTVDSNGLIYAAGDDSNLCVINPDGVEIARFDGNGHWLSFPVVSGENTIILGDSQDYTMLITDANNTVWAISGDGCEGEELDLYWQGGPQDLDDNGAMDFNDLEILAVDWLKCTDCSELSACWPIEVMFLTSDINKDKYVNFADFALLAERWLGGN